MEQIIRPWWKELDLALYRFLNIGAYGVSAFFSVQFFASFARDPLSQGMLAALAMVLETSKIVTIRKAERAKRLREKWIVIVTTLIVLVSLVCSAGGALQIIEAWTGVAVDAQDAQTEVKDEIEEIDQEISGYLKAIQGMPDDYVKARSTASAEVKKLRETRKALRAERAELPREPATAFMLLADRLGLDRTLLAFGFLLLASSLLELTIIVTSGKFQKNGSPTPLPEKTTAEKVIIPGEEERGEGDSRGFIHALFENNGYDFLKGVQQASLESKFPLPKARRLATELEQVGFVRVYGKKTYPLATKEKILSYFGQDEDGAQ